MKCPSCRSFWPKGRTRTTTLTLSSPGADVEADEEEEEALCFNGDADAMLGR